MHPAKKRHEIRKFVAHVVYERLLMLSYIYVFPFQYRVLLYVSKQQQVTHAKINTAFIFTVSIIFILLRL